MKTKLIADIENAQLKQDVPDFSPGDTVVVQVKVKEGTPERLQLPWHTFPTQCS